MDSALVRQGALRSRDSHTGQFRGFWIRLSRPLSVDCCTDARTFRNLDLPGRPTDLPNSSCASDTVLKGPFDSVRLGLSLAISNVFLSSIEENEFERREHEVSIDRRQFLGMAALALSNSAQSRNRLNILLAVAEAYFDETPRSSRVPASRTPGMEGHRHHGLTGEGLTASCEVDIVGVTLLVNAQHERLAS